MDLLTIWILYAIIGVTIFSALFVWAVRSGQFRDQERARHLPLERPERRQERAESEGAGGEG
jgi:cbb3-type cytochrome oxidase maturation protein